jgi:Zn-dependent protease|tara:strand:- start:224 stop:1174 length:951 start_codon:yes stop_codon:yes gene_type:complete
MRHQTTASLVGVFIKVAYQGGLMPRDPRASRLEDDPFDKIRLIQENTPKKVQAPDLSQVLQNLWGMAYSQPVHHHKGKIWHFSKEEKKHLLLATGAFTLALGFMTAGGILRMSAVGPIYWLTTVLIMMPIMLVAVGPAFLLHEIGHKLVAKHYGCWAEFRADPKGLKFGVMIAFVLGIVFMAPGAVMVAGRVSRKQNGHIAAAGPLVNLGLFLIGIPLGAVLLAIVGVSNVAILSEQGLSIPAMTLFAVQYWLIANLVLGLFNMLPFGPLDGLKVKEWSEGAFYALISIFVGLGLLWYLGKIDVMGWVFTLSDLIS